MFSSSIEKTEVVTYARSHRPVHIKCVNFTECKLYHNEVYEKKILARCHLLHEACSDNSEAGSPHFFPGPCCLPS